MIRFVAFEGIDGCGKDTQAELLREAWRAQGRAVLGWAEPARDFVRSLLGTGEGIDAHALLFAADRLMSAPHLAGALADGYHVVQTRSWMSTMVYQRSRWSFRALELMHERLTLWPDVVVVLDVTLDVALQRIEARGKPLEVYETRKALEPVAEAYAAFVRTKTYCGRPIVGVDGQGSPEEVHQRVLHALEEVDP